MSKFTTTPERRANLVKLARFLWDNADELSFSMYDFAELDGVFQTLTDVRTRPACGTVCCAVGHGPQAGIPPLEKEGWFTYGSRVFVYEHDDEWPWLFDQAWYRADDTPEGAAKRILWLLLHGLPKDAKEQMYREVPLCYADWTPTEADWHLAETGGVS